MFLIRFFTVLLALLLTCSAQISAAGELYLLAGAGLRQPTDQLIISFQKQTGHRVFVDYGGSGTLLARIIASGQGDLYMPGAFYYIRVLEEKGRLHSFRKIVAHTPVIGVNCHKTDLIQSFEDLTRPGVRLALGDPKAMAFGRLAMDILESSKMKKAILENVVVYGATVKQLALYVVQGDVDASIIGRSDAVQYKDKIQIVPIPPAYFHAETIAIALLKDSAKRPEAGQLLDFMSSEEAIRVFQSFGFLPLTGSER